MAAKYDCPVNKTILASWWNKKRKGARRGTTSDRLVLQQQLQEDPILQVTESKSIFLSSNYDPRRRTQSRMTVVTTSSQGRDQVKNRSPNMTRTRTSSTSTNTPAFVAGGAPAAGAKNEVLVGNMKEKKSNSEDRITIINQNMDKISRRSQMCCLGTSPTRQEERRANATRSPFGRTTTTTDAKSNRSKACNKNNNSFPCRPQRTGYHFIKCTTSNFFKKTMRRRKFISLTRTFLEIYDTTSNIDGIDKYEDVPSSISVIRFCQSEIFATTPLHIACEEGEPPETIASIIALGIPVNITDDHQGRVPLHYAVESICNGVVESVDEGIKTVKMLCSKDAKLVHQMDRNLDTPIDIIHDTIVTACCPTSKIPREVVRNKYSSYYCSKKGIFPSFFHQHPHPPQRNKVSHQDLERLYLELKKISIDVYREQKQEYEAQGQSIKSFAKVVEDHVLNT